MPSTTVPTPEIHTGPPDLDPALGAIATDLLQRMQGAFLQVAADPDRAHPAGTVEHDFRRALAALRPDAVARHRERALAELAPSGRPAERYGRYAQPIAHLPAFADTTRSPVRVDVAPDRIRAAIAAIPRPTPFKPKLHFDLAVVKTVGLRIVKVRCDDETNGLIGESGDDEIFLGGIEIDHLGNSAVVKPFLVGDEFDDGEQVTYGATGREFCTFPVTTAKPWPRTYTAVVIMAEEDAGGFANGLVVAWAKAAPTIKAEVEKYVSGAAGILVGEVIGEIIGKVLATVLIKFIDWIVDLFADDVFRAGTAIVGLNTWLAGGLPAPWKTLERAPNKQPLALALPNGTFVFKGHGGQYSVTVHWRVEAAIT